MAKKLIYNYTFTPGAAGAGTIAIHGNYPAKVWQIVTDVGTEGLYPHVFVRDEYADTTGAIEIISGGSGDLIVSTTGTSFDENTGIITITTTTSHGLSTGATIKIRELGLTFTCAKDNYTTEHLYPRTTDPIYDTAIAITVLDADTFTANVGRPSGGAISSNNEIIYNFADSAKGGSTYYDRVSDTTTLTLKHDTSHLDPLDQLQIFIDIQEDKINFSETFTDPVSKLRVSNPQNLIDTDFEYGLQPTKWETIELVNNVPSFFASSTDYSISDITSVTTINGSENITVSTLEAHGLSVGSPIDVTGLTSRTAEGKFLVTSIISANSFVYKAKAPQSSTGSINTVYSTIVPGEFYSGSEIKINEADGIETDGASPSKLEISTNYHHGFGRGSSLYFTNTIGRRTISLQETTSAIAPDGRPYIDYENTLSVTKTNVPTLTETRQMKGTYSYKFDLTAVDTFNSTITWPSHGLSVGDALLYSKPSGDIAIDGLQDFQIYYVYTVPSDDTITLTTDQPQSSSRLLRNLNTVNATADYGRHILCLCYPISQVYSPTNSYSVWLYTSGWTNGQDRVSKGYTYDAASGTYGYFGLMGKRPSRYMIVYSNNFLLQTVKGPYFGGYYNSNLILGSTKNDYNFLEDFQRWNSTSSDYSSMTGGNNYTGHTYTLSDRIVLDNATYNYYSSSVFYNSSSSTTPNIPFFVPLEPDPEADSLYIGSHGFESGANVTVTTDSGSDIVYRTDTGTSYSTTPTTSTFTSGSSSRVTKISNDRIQLQSASRVGIASGSYTLAGSISNPTANSFYISGHDLVNNTQMTFSAVNGAPTTASGAAALTFNTISTVYAGIVAGVESVKSAMGADSGNLLMNGTSHWAPFSTDRLTFDGAYQYIVWYLTTYQVVSGATGATLANVSVTPYNFATGTAWDPASSTSLANKGFYHITTPLVTNQKTPYWINIYQVPNPTLIGQSSLRVEFTGRLGYNYGISGIRGSESNTYPSGWTTATDGFQYTYDSHYFAPTSAYHGMMSLAIILENTGWDGYGGGQSQIISFSTSRDIAPNATSYAGSRYHIEVLVPILYGSARAGNYGTSGTVINTATMVSTIVNGAIAYLSNQTLTEGTVFATPIDDSRFSLKNSSGSVYDISGFGTSPYSFTLSETTGALDGYYSVDTVTDTTIGHFSQSTLPKRVITADNADIVEINSNIYINAINSKFKTQQKLVYTASGGEIPGLTTDTTYYAIAIGPDHIQLASSASDASSGVAIAIGTTAAGTFTFTTPTVSGISSASGTIGVTTSSGTVTGTNTLFKRFFKTGDKFIVSDTNETPPEYREFEVATVIDDTELTLTQNPGIALTDGTHYVETKIHTRPDGTFVHRPFDGGVEITAGTSPNSSIVRQTRKYFRYQSGKGIQCSVAVNFNPTRIANSLVSTANTSLPAKTHNININNNASNSYNLSGNDRNGRVIGENNNVTLLKGDTVNFIVNASGHPLWIKTDVSTGTGNSITSDITNNGTESGTISWDTTNVGVGTYYYNCENHASMNGSIYVEAAGITTTIATATTRYPHGLVRNSIVSISGASDSAYNGDFTVQASDDFTFNYYLPNTSIASNPNGVVEYHIDSWTNSAVRCGLFDYQNGMFYEFDGSTLYAVRRSSVQQLSGTVVVQNGSNIVNGTDTNFSGQLNVGDFVVIRGMSHRITYVASRTQIHVQPAYKGISASGVIMTKTVDTKVPQSQWNIDKADGSGPSGFILDTTKIQMIYIDYSWYGAGKIRFGFKDANGHVKYMHEFLHNNINTEAYMRSGNIPGRYEIENTTSSIPSYVPSLFHWGTSVIMDGRFDDDKAYLFTASSNTLSFTNGDFNSINTNADSILYSQYNTALRQYDHYVRLSFAVADAPNFSSGVSLFTADNELNGQVIDFTQYSGSDFYVYIYISSSRRQSGAPVVYPSVLNGTAVSIGAPATGGDTVNLQEQIPLISIRLAPSADNNLTGSLGQRDIINRMQLQLKELGITLSHDCTVNLILNGAIDNRNYQDVQTPSLSELVKHTSGDKVIGGTPIYSLRASGGTENAAGKRLSSTSDFDISQITDLGNSILGGDGTFPNGPDLLTIAIVPIDTSEINADTPLTVSSRISWTESQA